MEEHPLFEQGDTCPAIRLPLQQFEAMDKADLGPLFLITWNVATSYSKM
jgi:hypothetical protein